MIFRDFWIKGHGPTFSLITATKKQPPPSSRYTVVKVREVVPDAVMMTREQLSEIRTALDCEHSLSIAWAGSYQYNHKLDDFHPEHKLILDRGRKALAEIDRLLE